MQIKAVNTAFQTNKCLFLGMKHATFGIILTSNYLLSSRSEKGDSDNIKLSEKNLQKVSKVELLSNFQM